MHEKFLDGLISTQGPLKTSDVSGASVFPI